MFYSLALLLPGHSRSHRTSHSLEAAAAAESQSHNRNNSRLVDRHDDDVCRRRRRGVGGREIEETQRDLGNPEVGTQTRVAVLLLEPRARCSRRFATTTTTQSHHHFAYVLNADGRTAECNILGEGNYLVVRKISDRLLFLVCAICFHTLRHLLALPITTINILIMR